MNTDSILLFLGELFAKSFAVLLIAAVIVRVWHRATAAQRHLVWCAAMVTMLFLPMTKLFAPRWSVPFERNAKVRLVMPELPLAPLVSTPLPTDAETPPPPRAARWTLPDWRKILPGVWLGGAVFLLGSRLLGSWRLHRLQEGSVPLEDARIRETARRVLRELSIDRQVEVRISEECRVPMTWGTWRPVLMLPVEALQWSDTHLLTALRHEAGHILRQDYLVRWMAQIACAAYWPNPLAWLAARALRVAQEQATDDLVLRAGTPPDEYAELLVAAARMVAMRSPSVAMASPSTLAGRVLAIVDGQRDRRPLSRWAVAAGSLVVAGVLGVCTAAQLQGEDRAALAEKEPEVQISVKFIEITPSDSLPPIPGFDLIPRTDKIFNHASVYSVSQFGLIMREMNRKDGVDVLSSPRVIVRSKQSAKIEVVRPFSYPTEWEKGDGVVVDSSGQVPRLQWKPKAFGNKDTGVTLEVTPEIKADGSIELQLKPHVTEFDGFVDLDDPKSPRVTGLRGIRTKPVFAEQEVETTVTLKSGETVALNGIQEMADGKMIKKPARLAKLVVFVTATTIEPGPPKTGQQISGQQINAGAMQQLLELANSGRPDELLDPLRVPKINDPTVVKTLPLLQETIAEEMRLSKSGLAGSDPKMKVLEERKATYLKTLNDRLSQLREPQTYTGQLDAAAIAKSPVAQQAAAIVIPRLEFREATVAESIQLLRLKDSDRFPDLKPINIFLNLPPSAELARITISLKNVSILDAARYVAKLADLPFSLEPDALVIGDPARPVAVSVESAALDKARKIIFPKVEFHQASVSEAVDFIRRKAAESDPEQQGVNIVLKPGSATDAKITLSLINVPMIEVLRYVARLADLEVKAEPAALILQPAGSGAGEKASHAARPAGPQ